MKRWFTLAISILVVMSLLIGCSSKSSNSKSENGKTTITFFHRWPNEPYKSYYKQIIAEFEKQNPDINIEEVTALNDDYKQKANVILGSKNPPDIFFSWVGEYGEKFIRDGVALDLSEYYAADTEWSSQLIESQVEHFKRMEKYTVYHFLRTVSYFSTTKRFLIS